MRIVPIVLASVVIAGCAQPEITYGLGPHALAHPEALLFSGLFPDVLVEVDYVAGYRPSAYALEGIEADLRALAGKSRVQFLPLEEIPPQGEFVSAARLDDIAASTATAVVPGTFANGSRAFLHIIYLEGEYEKPAMGLYAYTTGAIFLFTRTLDTTGAGYVSAENTGLGLDREKRERFILRHELGHAFGLVGCRIPMVRPHNEARDPCHSSNGESIMAVHRTPSPTGNPSEFVARGVDNYRADFDADDRADLRSFQASAPVTVWPSWR